MRKQSGLCRAEGHGGSIYGDDIWHLGCNNEGVRANAYLYVQHMLVNQTSCWAYIMKRLGIAARRLSSTFVCGYARELLRAVEPAAQLKSGG